jgi:CHAT domain-containing protein
VTVCTVAEEFRRDSPWEFLGGALEKGFEEFRFLLPEQQASCDASFLSLASEFLEIGGLLKLSEVTDDGNRQAIEAFEWLSRIEERYSLCSGSAPILRSNPYLAIAYLRADKSEQLQAILKDWAKALYNERWSVEAEAMQKTVYDAELFGWPLSDIVMNAVPRQKTKEELIYFYWDLISRLKGRSLIQLREAFRVNRERNDTESFGRFIREFHTHLAERTRPFAFQSTMDEAVTEKAISDWARKAEQLLPAHLITSGTLPTAQILELLSRLPPRVVVADYYRFRPVTRKPGLPTLWQDDRYGVFVADASGVEFIDLGEADAIDNVIRIARDALADEPSERAIVSQSHRLALQNAYERLVGRFESRLSSAKGLVVSGDSILSSLPFAPLIDRSGRFLINSVDVSYVDTLRELSEEKVGSISVKSGPLAAIYDVDFKKQSMPPGVASISKKLLEYAWDGLTPIPEEKSTIEALRQFGRARLLNGRVATERSLRRLKSPTVLHISSHSFRLDCTSVSYERGSDDGFIQPCPDPSRPAYDFGSEFPAKLPPIEVASPDELAVRTMQNSALALSAKRFDIATDDGFLSASEAMELDLRGTRLVFLASCDSGAGDGTQLEGAYNLRRGFMLAGSARQIVAAWPIPSISTSHLTRRFYTALSPGTLSPLSALSLVQRQMSAEVHPYFWASFRLYGRHD